MTSNGLDKTLMKGFTAVGLAAALSLSAGTAYAQSHKLDISQDQMRLAERGWTTARQRTRATRASAAKACPMTTAKAVWRGCKGKARPAVPPPRAASTESW